MDSSKMLLDVYIDIFLRRKTNPETQRQIAIVLSVPDLI